jgi:hypothetical protein
MNDAQIDIRAAVRCSKLSRTAIKLAAAATDTAQRNPYSRLVGRAAVCNGATPTCPRRAAQRFPGNQITEYRMTSSLSMSEAALLVQELAAQDIDMDAILRRRAAATPDEVALRFLKTAKTRSPN